jgi:hypothetical protein
MKLLTITILVLVRQAEGERERRVKIGVDKRTTVVFPAPLMTSIAELGAFLARGRAAAGPGIPTHPQPAARAALDAVALNGIPGPLTRAPREEADRGRA